jgi:ABC-2 type transport system permease protein
MAIYRRGYQRYKGPIMSHWTRCMVLPRYAWHRLFRQRLVVLLLVIASIWPLLCAVYIYLANHADLLKGLGGEVGRFLQINGKFFLVFMDVQSVFAIFLAALTGPGLIAPDLANNALPLYFSRPLTRTDYILARLMVLVGMLSLITWFPGLLLFGMQSSMAASGWLQANLYLGRGILLGFFIWVLLVSFVALACSAYVKWRIVAGALVLAFFFVLGGVSLMINGVFRVTWGHALNPAWGSYRLWCALFGVDPPQGPGTLTCILALTCMVLFLAAVLNRKLRPVEVIS